MEHDHFCNCEDCYFARDGHEVCGTCGCLVGHGCPESEPCERADCQLREGVHFS